MFAILETFSGVQLFYIMSIVETTLLITRPDNSDQNKAHDGKFYTVQGKNEYSVSATCNHASQQETSQIFCR